MRGSAVKIALLTAAIAFLTLALGTFAQQTPQQPQQQQPQQPGAPSQQPPASTPPDSQPLPPRPSPGSDSSSQESSSKKDLPPDDSATKEKAHTAKPGVLPPEDDPAWDPFHAQQDVDIGTFYMHKGDTDAAIARFEDAIRLRANFAKPRLLLAEAYEKKGDKSEAVHYYQEYLKVLPNAPDAKRIQQKIQKLSGK
jgi:tetratricopeptide (TPR) repeat protein